MKTKGGAGPKMKRPNMEEESVSKKGEAQALQRKTNKCRKERIK